MRTSPLGMRRILRRAPSALVVALALLVVTGAACSDDGDDDGTSPTTTSPASSTTEPDDADDGSTTTAEPADPGDPTEPGSSTTAPPAEGEGEALTAASAESELDRLFGLYQGALQGAKQRGGLDEQFRAELAGVMTPGLLGTEIEQLTGIDVPARLGDPVPAVTVDTVEVSGGSPTCAWGSAAIDFTPFYGDAAPGPQTYYFRLADRNDAGWRLDSIGFTESGEPYAGLECQE